MTGWAGLLACLVGWHRWSVPLSWSEWSERERQTLLWQRRLCCRPGCRAHHTRGVMLPVREEHRR